MTRRQALLAGFLSLLGKQAQAQVLSQTLPKLEPSHLTIPLDQWASITVQYKGKSVTLPIAEVFDTLTELPQ